MNPEWKAEYRELAWELKAIFNNKQLQICAKYNYNNCQTFPLRIIPVIFYLLHQNIPLEELL